METLNYLDRLKRFEQSVMPAKGQLAAAPIMIEPAHSNARAIYFEQWDGRILGPAVPECLAQVGDDFWIVATFAGQPRWIRSDRLRSRKAFEQQAEVREVELIPKGLL